jgi:uroporphyrinogen III methyltransferase / synthase
VTVYLVGAGPGDPGLLTRRGAKLVSQADVVIFDRLVHRSLLALAPSSAELVDVGKRPDAAQSGTGRQAEINRLLVAHGRQSHTVVRLKGGDPFLFGRGGEEGDVLTRAGVPWQIVPGVSSAFGVPAAAGIPVTHRGLSSSVTVVTGRVGDPTAPGGVDWDVLAKVGGTLVILMGMQTRAEIADALQRGGKPADTPTAVIERGTTTTQRVVRTTLDRLADVDLGSPAVIVVGAVAALGEDAPVDPPGPLSARTVVVTRSGPRAHGLVDALQRAGAETIEVPLTEQTEAADGGAALRDAAAEVAQYRWVVLTSVNAVHRFMASLRDARALGSTKVAAVGPATAVALRRTGVEPDLVPAEHWASGLVDAFPPAGLEPHAARVLFPCADQAPSTIEDGLAHKGWDVRRVEAYRTVALPPPEPELMAKMADADAVTFTASSSVKAFVALRLPDGRPLSVPPLVLCIGPTTTASASALGLAGVRMADEASTEGIVAALIRHFYEGEPGGS